MKNKIRDISKKKEFHIFLRLLISSLFLLSAFSKLLSSKDISESIEDFEQNYILNQLNVNEYIACYISRIVLGTELFLGLTLLQIKFLKKIIYPFSIFVLLIFSVFLTYKMIITGDTGNCGCFGELIPMTPLQALVKNIIGILVLCFLYNKAKPTLYNKLQFLLLLFVFSSFILSLFYLYPIDNCSPQNTAPPSSPPTDTIIIKDTIVELVPKKIDNVSDSLKIESKDSSEQIYDTIINVVDKVELKVKSTKSNFSNYIDSDKIDINKGKVILCVLSPDCEKCIKFFKQINSIQPKMNDSVQIYIVFCQTDTSNSQKLINDFFKNTNTSNNKYKYQIRKQKVRKFTKEVTGSSCYKPYVCCLWNGNEYLHLSHLCKFGEIIPSEKYRENYANYILEQFVYKSVMSIK